MAIVTFVGGVKIDVNRPLSLPQKAFAEAKAVYEIASEKLDAAIDALPATLSNDEYAAETERLVVASRVAAFRGLYRDASLNLIAWMRQAVEARPEPERSRLLAMLDEIGPYEKLTWLMRQKLLAFAMKLPCDPAEDVAKG